MLRKYLYKTAAMFLIFDFLYFYMLSFFAFAERSMDQVLASGVAAMAFLTLAIFCLAVVDGKTWKK